MEAIMVNIWGKQTEAQLGTWEEIKKLGFRKKDRSFGSLNEGTQALFFCKPNIGSNVCAFNDWYITTEKLENIND